MTLYECPICHQPKMTEFPPGTGDTFILTEADTKTNTFYPNAGLPVKLMACANCKTILLKNENLNFEPK